MTETPLTLESLWCSLLVRRIRWAPSNSFLGAQLLRKAEALELPAMRSRLGKHCRRAVCPEVHWQEPCGGCAVVRTCSWPRLFPGSALGLSGVAPLAGWVLARDGGGFLSTHFGLDPETFMVVGRALDDAFADSLGLDRRGPADHPRWLTPYLMDGDGRSPLLPLPWGVSVPMSPPPSPLAEGSAIRFRTPLDLKTANDIRPPAMAEWLRLGRNRLHRLATQNGFGIWPREDPRWAALNQSAEASLWSWSEPSHGTPWRPLAKYQISLRGWTGLARIEHLPEAWAPWAALLPAIGVGSHIPYGCGLGTIELMASPPQERMQGCGPATEPQIHRIIPLAWRADLAREAGG